MMIETGEGYYMYMYYHIKSVIKVYSAMLSQCGYKLGPKVERLDKCCVKRYCLATRQGGIAVDK